MDNQDNSTPEPSDTEVHDQLMAEAAAADVHGDVAPNEQAPSAKQGVDGEGKEETETRAADSKADDNTTDNPESSAEITDDQGRRRGPDGKFLPKEKEEEKPAEQETETRPEDSKYAKARKDAERLDRSWKALDAEKAQTRAERAEVQRLAAQVQQLRQQQQQPQQFGARFDSRQYQLAAGEFEKRASKLMDEGDIDGAKEQIDLANKSRAASYQAAQQEHIEAQRGFEAGWRANAEKLIHEHPELGDPNSEDAQRMVAILESEPLLAHVSDGFNKAYTAMQLQRDAAEASGLRDENIKLKAENERLTKLVSPQGPKGSPTHSASKKFESMTLDEQHAHLQREAELADST